MSLISRLAGRTFRSQSPAPAARPLCEPLEGRQLLSAVDLGVLEVKNPVLPANLKVNARPKGAAVVVVQNQGEVRYRGKVTIELQLSPDGQWDDANPALKTVTKNVKGLKVNGKRAFRIKLPKIGADVPEGTYHIAARITVTGEASADTANNTGAGWKTTHTGTPGLTAPTKPNTPSKDPEPDPPTKDPEPGTPTYVDLGIVPSISVNRLEGASEAVITFTITNHGTATVVESISVDLWAGPNPDNTDGDIYLGGGGGEINLAPGESKTFSETIIAPIEHTGIVYFRAEMYDVTLIDLEDVNPSNNQTATGPVEIWHKDVNLSGAWAFNANPSQPLIVAVPGEVVQLRLEVTNTGTETFTGPIRASMLALPRGLSLRTSSADITLAPGETRSVVVDLTVSPLLAPGDYALRGQLDVNYNEGPGGNADNDFADELTLRVV